MKSIIKSAIELKHPGFIVFEGLDFTGKTYLAKNAIDAMKRSPHFKLDLRYNHNHGFLNKDLVDEAHLKSLAPNERVDYLIECYSKDFLPPNPREFSEIFQDRHLPYLIFYAVTKCNKKTEDFISQVKGFTKPKHIFLVECSYAKRRRRALQKSYTKNDEMSTVASKEIHENLKGLYRDIVKALEIPSTVIDTTYEKDLLNHFFDALKDSDTITYNVNLDDLVVDHEASVFESTSKFKLEGVLNGKKHPPISIVRRIDENLNYIEMIRDGRHRAYAALKAGHKTISSYISYEPVSRIDTSSLKRLKDFSFREVERDRLHYKLS